VVSASGEGGGRLKARNVLIFAPRKGEQRTPPAKSTNSLYGSSEKTEYEFEDEYDWGSE
jgi:hypothetical protein